MVINNMRGKKTPLLLPRGYYSNGFVFPAAITTAGEISRNPLGYALKLVKEAKGEASVEYIKSVADLMVTRGRPCFTPVRSWVVSNMTRIGFIDADFGWGKAVYAGLAKAGLGPLPGVSFSVACTNNEGEEGRAVLMCLPPKAMMRFSQELDIVLGSHAIRSLNSIGGHTLNFSGHVADLTERRHQFRYGGKKR